MLTMSAEGMNAIEIKRAQKREQLRNLMHVPFDINNKALIAALNSHMNDFEYSSNQMYLYQSLNEVFKYGGIGGWIGAKFIPVPEVVTSLVSVLFYVGLAGHLLEKFSLTDFYEQVSEMKLIYNWCLKNGDEHYNYQIDNTKKLAQPEIQRLIKSLAPLCSIDFMLAWTRVTVKPDENKASWNPMLSTSISILSTGVSIVTLPLSFFSSSKASLDLTKILELKTAVETQRLNIGVFQGFQNAMNYFATNPEFREILKSKINLPIEKAKEFLPQLMSKPS